MAQRGQKYGRIFQLVLLNSVSSELQINLIALQSIIFSLKLAALQWLNQVAVDIFYILKYGYYIMVLRTSVTFLMMSCFTEHCFSYILARVQYRRGTSHCHLVVSENSARNIFLHWSNM